MTNSINWQSCLCAAALFITLAGCQSTPPKIYPSADDATSALVSALRAEDVKQLKVVFGDEGKAIISSGDTVADKASYAQFLSLYDQKQSLIEDPNGVKTLVVGPDDWPFPIPLVKGHLGWSFDTAAGKDELLNRRIGKNELSTIQVCLAIVDAQREFARLDPDANGLPDYARKIISSPGQRDGLYWPTAQGEAQSPLGPLVATAADEGYAKKLRAKGQPPAYHGYRYRLLTQQGPDATGGAYDYQVKGKLLSGFALVAWPAEYGNSGVMTFIVSHAGVVYQKDLGNQTSRTASSMRSFNPDPTWTAAK